MKLPFVFAIQMIVSATVSPGVARAIDPVAILAPSDVPEGFGNGFGSSIAISGDYVVVGAKLAPYFNGNREGAAYVSRRYGDRWIEQAKLLGSETVAYSQLGWAVDIDGDVIVAGAPRWEFNTCGFDRPGSVYVFRRDDQGTPDDPADDTWPEEAILTVADPRISEFFGMSVAVSGDVIVVGGQCGNTVEVFRRRGRKWRHEDSLSPAQTSGRVNFGLSLDIDADRIVSGAYRSFDESTGAAYVFVRKGAKWVEEATLLPSDHTTPDSFGWSVSVSGRSIVVGAPGIGSAYVYAHTASGRWLEQAIVKAPQTASVGQFGFAVSVNRDIVLVGPETGEHLTYIFNRVDGLWSPMGELLHTELQQRRSLAIKGDYAATSTLVYAVRNQHALSDLAGFQNCFRPSVDTEPSPACQPYDLTADRIVDLDDYEVFIGTFVGPLAVTRGRRLRGSQS